MRWVLFLLALPATLLARLDSRGDFQVWNKYSLFSPMRGCWSTLLEAEFRWGDNAEQLYYSYIQWHMIYRPYYWLEIAPSFRQAERRVFRRNLRWTPEGDPMLAVTLFWRRGPLEIQDRSRFQYRYFMAGNVSDDFFYRNRIRLEYHWRRGSWCITPFISNETFLRTGVGISQNRTKIGAVFQRSPAIKIRPFYLLRFRRGTYQNGFGLYLYLEV